MKWRDSAGLIIAVLILLGFSAQPVARWIVKRTVSQYVPGKATMAGNASWDPVRHTWTCDELHVESGGGDSFHASRATIRLDASELIRRNLVIDSLRVDGVVVHGPRRPQDLYTGALRAEATFPSFSPDAWADTLLNAHKGMVLSASQRREHCRSELEQQLEQLQKRCADLEIATSANPLRNRIDFQEVRRDVAQLVQSLAEERIRIREADRELATRAERFQASWRDDLARSIFDLLPDQSLLVQLIARKSLAQYWESRERLMSYASLTARPLKEREVVGRGTEVSIPGLTKNYVMIRSANLAGTIAIEDQQPIRFRAVVTGWGDTYSTLDPKSEWQFEFAGSNGSSMINARVERIQPPKSMALSNSNLPDATGEWATDQWYITWTEHPNPELTCRGRWQTTSNGQRCDLSIPLDSIAELSRSSMLAAFEGKNDWESCWSKTIDGYRGRYLHASMLLDLEGSIDPSNPPTMDPEVSEESLSLVSEIWKQTLATYILRASDRMGPRIAGLHAAMEMFRRQCWSDGMQQHVNSLGELERKALLLRENCDDYGSFKERLARMRGGEIAY